MTSNRGGVLRCQDVVTWFEIQASCEFLIKIEVFIDNDFLTESVSHTRNCTFLETRPIYMFKQSTADKQKASDDMFVFFFFLFSFPQ